MCTIRFTKLRKLLRPTFSHENLAVDACRERRLSIEPARRMHLAARFENACAATD
jgi:hypothetical protein